MHGLTMWLAAPAAALRMALALLFLRSAWTKSRDLPGFAEIVGNYRLLPDRMVRPAASLLLVSEASLAVLLASGLLATLAGYAAAGLLALFASAMAINLLRGRTDISCGCLPASVARPHLSWRGVLATTALILPAILAAQGWHVADTVTLLQAGFAGLLLYSLHDAAIRLGAPPAARQKS